MARYRGPKAKLCRREGVNLFGLPKITRVLTRRNYPPGIHGAQKQTISRSKQTEYGLQLREKQKVKRTYGLLEKQFKNYFIKAGDQKGDVGYNLQRLLEMRLDNVVYRLGLAKSRAQARQLVNHAHLLVNQKKVNIPSYHVSVGDTIEVNPKNAENKFFQEIKEGQRETELPKWFSFDHKKLSGKVVSEPPEEDLAGRFDMKLIIEFYSR